MEETKEDGIQEAQKWMDTYFGHITNMVVPPGGGAGRKDRTEEPPVEKTEWPVKKTEWPVNKRQTQPDDPEKTIYLRWVTDVGACLICLANEEAGPVPNGDPFPSGDTAPPAHKNCHCGLAQVDDLDAWWDQYKKAHPQQFTEPPYWNLHPHEQ